MGNLFVHRIFWVARGGLARDGNQAPPKDLRRCDFGVDFALSTAANRREKGPPHVMILMMLARELV
jgi:hypothetical protein